MGMAYFAVRTQICCFEQNSANQQTFNRGSISIGFA
jgi:hypothetical protein